MSKKHRSPKQVGKCEQPMFRSLTPKQHAAYMVPKLVRQMKRQLIASGQIMDPANRPKRFEFNWVWGELTGVVQADDISTARSLIKKNLGLAKKRLPMGVEITRTVNMTYYQGVAQTVENLNNNDGESEVSPDVGVSSGLDSGSDGGQTG